jgi:hypothetical protein
MNTAISPAQKPAVSPLAFSLATDPTKLLKGIFQRFPGPENKYPTRGNHDLGLCLRISTEAFLAVSHFKRAKTCELHPIA